MKKWIITALVAVVSLTVVPATASARSYQATAVNKANRWAYNTYPRALYFETQCYLVGYRRADCTVYITKANYGACSVSVIVSGRYYRVRKYDSVC